jgi:hypothetical protein
MRQRRASRLDAGFERALRNDQNRQAALSGGVYLTLHWVSSVKDAGHVRI